MNEEKGQWRHPRLSDRDLLLCIGGDLKRLYEDSLRQTVPDDIGVLLQKIEQAERERILRKQ
jgi:anti-sigma factor NepR-like protein